MSSNRPLNQVHKRTPGLLQIWERRRRIPSTLYQDPLQHVFDEFDEDGDGTLSADEVSPGATTREPDSLPSFATAAYYP